ncbi:MAG: WD40 repeat domain-containing protein, partial [Chloroflexota bacterium]
MPSKPTIFYLVLLLVFMGACSPNDANEMPLPADDTPYIWWYADSENAFVVERADGTDSQLIGEGVVPDEHDILEDVAFSPSGEWFAWRSTVYGYGNDPYIGSLLRVSDNTRSNLLDDFHDIRLLHWSPIEDWLFVANRTDRNHEILSIIDVVTGDLLAQVRLNLSVAYGYNPHHQNRYGWSEDSQFFYYDAGGYRYDLHVDGSVDVYHWQQLYSWNDVFVLSYVFTDEGYAVLENTQTGQQIPLYEAPHYDVDTYLYVNPTRTHVLNILHPSTGKEVHLIDVETETVTRLSDALSVVPESLDPDHSRPTWSPDGQFAFLFDDDNRPHLLDVLSGDVTQIALPEDTSELEYWYWLPSINSIVMITSDSAVCQYSIESNELTMLSSDIDPDWNGVPQLYPSPDGRSLGSSNKADRLLDLDTDEILTLPTHSSTIYRDGRWHRMQWHENSEWFFTSQFTQFANDGGYTSHTIRHVDGNWRELGFCRGECIGFVPSNAVDNLPAGEDNSVVQAPIASLLHEGEVTGVAWHPTENQVIVYEQVEREAYLTHWDIGDTSNPEQVEQYRIDFWCASDPIGCRLIWQDDETILVYGRLPTQGDGGRRSIATFDIPSESIVDIAYLPTDWYRTSPDGQL